MVFRGRKTESLPDGFEEALRRGFVGPPSQEAEERHLELMLAADPELATPATQVTHSSGTPALGPWARARLAITLAAVLLALPVAFAGLALAGVRLPEPVDSAFETVGIDLPNQPPDEDDEEGEPARVDQPGSQGSAGDSASGDGQSADEESSADGKRKGADQAPTRAQDGSGSGSSLRPSHAQDGETGAPAHSQQGGQGEGTPPPHAQDGNGAPPPDAQGGSPKDPKPPKPESTEPTPKKPKPVAPETENRKPTKPDSTELESDQ